MFFIYRILTNILFLLSPIIFIFRIFKKKEDINRFKEKYCIYPKKNFQSTIWFHAVSVGELMSIIPLIIKLEKNKKVKKIIITSSTISSSKIFEKQKFKKTIHKFFPLDTSFLTKKFINFWNPKVAIFVDSEIWPNMIRNLENKYETRIGENGIKLSGGEKQRLSIARAFLKKSKIILLDEATSSLDSETEEKIQSALNKLILNKTTIVIAHRLSTILNSDKIYVVDQGKIIDSGNHKDLLSSSNVYKNFYERQIKQN